MSGVTNIIIILSVSDKKYPIPTILLASGSSNSWLTSMVKYSNCWWTMLCAIPDFPWTIPTSSYFYCYIYFTWIVPQEKKEIALVYPMHHIMLYYVTSSLPLHHPGWLFLYHWVMFPSTMTIISASISFGISAYVCRWLMAVSTVKPIYFKHLGAQQNCPYRGFLISEIHLYTFIL